MNDVVVVMPTDELPLPLLRNNKRDGAKACSDVIRREKRREEQRTAAIIVASMSSK